MKGVILLAAGGTGGHLFPAEALAIALEARGWLVHLATDERVEDYSHSFPAEAIHIVPSATLTRSPAAIGGLFTLGRGYLIARRLIRKLKPAVVVGFGGYPTLPPVLAASRAKIPTVIHDANAVLGRANRFLASRTTAIATSFAKVGGAGAFAVRSVETGNPVRPMVLDAARSAYPNPAAGETFRLLVFGGSQGARFMSDLMPPTIAALDDAHRRRLHVTQQCRSEDLERVAAAYRELGVEADLRPFFKDLPARIAASHLVVCRSGASTVAELAAIGRPAIMVPLPHAIDQDQKANAQILSRAGGGWMVEQSVMRPDQLAEDIAELMDQPDLLIAAAAAALRVGRPDAVERLADLVEKIATEKTLANKKAVPA